MKTNIRGYFYFVLTFFIFVDISFPFSKENYNSDIIKSSFTFKEMNLLSDDMLLKGINPKYDFFIPTLSQLIHGKVILKLKASPHLKKDSKLTIFIDNLPYKTFSVLELPPEIEIPFKRKSNKEFAKITISGDLKISNNMCEDIFSNDIWLLIYTNSIIEFTYFKARNIREFIIDYNNFYCIDSHQMLPFIYQLCKHNLTPCNVNFQPQNTSFCKNIKPSQDNLIKFENNTLYISTLTSLAFEEGIFPNFIFRSTQTIKQVLKQPKETKSELSLTELGFQTLTIEGIGNISYTIPLDIAKLGGLPDKLYLKLFITHTPIYKNDNTMLNIYLNNKMIEVYPLESSGKKSIEIELPTNELFYGVNNITLNLTNHIPIDYCSKSVLNNILTVFGDSYFYWNNLETKPRTISDFLKTLNGYVAVIINDSNFYSYASKFISYLGIYNKNIKAIDLNPQDTSNYNFVILFENPKNTSNMNIDLSKGDFQIINPSTKKVIFSSKPSEDFGVMMLDKKNNKPALIFTYFPDLSGIDLFNLYNYNDMLELVGNVAITAKSFLSSYEVGNKLIVKYQYKKGIQYYWNKYKLWIVLFLIIPATLFVIYIYRNLTRRSVI